MLPNVDAKKVHQSCCSFEWVLVEAGGNGNAIGSFVVSELLKTDVGKVVIFDNFARGKRSNIQESLKDPRCEVYPHGGDVRELDILNDAMKGMDGVIHLAAMWLLHCKDFPRTAFHVNIEGTFNVLEAMRRNGVRKIAFASTGSVYGEAEEIPTPENAPFPIQTSLYGASKLACEGLIAAYCEGFQFQSWIFRFVSILGERYTHGHVFDFYRKLQLDPTRLEVLGNGRQRKSYLYVQDCLDAVLLALDKAKQRVNIINLGVNDSCEVNDSIRWICEALGLNPKLEYSGGDRGWIGDNPLIHLDPCKMMGMGWMPKLSIREGIVRTLTYLQENEWVFRER